MLTRILLPIVSVAFLVFAVLQMAAAQKKDAPVVPPVEPAKSPYNTQLAGAGIVVALAVGRLLPRELASHEGPTAAEGVAHRAAGGARRGEPVSVGGPGPPRPGYSKEGEGLNARPEESDASIRPNFQGP